ncbi:thiamine-phosphate kinase [uncultured Sphingomonas sp.]|uniref:thiamine-phosphate kinase n=1 Tax=uncultured Sphingomonas sp. TaxID=158754 RepID=UPI0035CA0E3B
MIEAEFLAALRTLPLHPGARGLADDAAVVAGLIVTTDTLVENVHFLSYDPPGDVAWKLVATNLSDLAAKGARPEGVLLSYPLGDDGWDRAFLAGLGEVLTAFDCPLIGGDTVSLPVGAPRVLTVTALGGNAVAPPRSGAHAGDALWVTGTIGDAGAGLAIAKGAPGPAELLDRYRRPQPRLAEGRALAPLVHAMMDVSDGLLIDASRMAAASGLAVTIDLAAVPLSPAGRAWRGDALAAATAGDDYELLFALPAGVEPPVGATRVGWFAAGAGLTLVEGERPVPLPDRLGFEHTPF